MGYVLGYDTSFDAAHHLPDYPGKCQRVHGHTWKVRVEIVGRKLENGMVMDFHILKDIVDGIVDKLDHQKLNDIVVNPTCEEIADYIFRKLSDRLHASAEVDSCPSILQITVWESDKTFCRLI